LPIGPIEMTQVMPRAEGGTGALTNADHRKEIEVADLNPFAQAASVSILAEYERTPTCVEALDALNRWPGRTQSPNSRLPATVGVELRAAWRFAAVT
jgi:hypothetical protein